MQKPSEIRLNQVLHGKNQDVLKDFPANFFDSVITDPPYELGFMSKAWDASGVAYSVTMWREVLRVAKPGATLFCFGGTRTYHRVACAIEDAGWQLKDSLVWLYGSGFPKSSNISKTLDKEAGATREVVATGRSGDAGTHKSSYQMSQQDQNTFGGEFDITAPATDIAKQWNGYGTALKPAFEPIILAMKPLEKGLTYAQNARKWGVAGLNIDAGRISTSDNVGARSRTDTESGSTNMLGVNKSIDFQRSGEVKGRWPANVILSHSPDCVQVGTEKIKGHTGYPDGPKGKSHHYSSQARSKDVRPNAWPGHADENGQETIDVYACVPNCPIRIMDTQSGQGKSGSHAAHHVYHEGGDVSWGKNYTNRNQPFINEGDSGGASRFFYTAKASRSERESGLKDFVPCAQCGEVGTDTHRAHTANVNDDLDESRPAGNCIRNNHPTVKPVAIMEYLCKLIKMPERRTPPTNDKPDAADGKPDPSKAQVILDPFCGSGTTLLAAEATGLKYIGIDMGIDNVIIATSRSIEPKLDDDDEATAASQDPATLAAEAQSLTTNDFDDLII